MSVAGTISRLVVAGLALGLLGCGPKPDAGNGDTPLKGEGVGGQVLTEEEKQARVAALRSSLGAPASADSSNNYNQPIEALGVEPYWTLTLLEEFATFQRPGLEEISGYTAQREVFAEGEFISVGPLAVAIRPAACTLGERAEQLPYKVTVMFEGDSFEGCGRAAGETGLTGGWAMALPEMLPAVDACLSKAQAKPGRVTIAYPRQSLDETEGAVTPAVRVLEADGGRFECVIDASKPGGVELQALSDRDQISGENEPVFTRSPTAAPKGDCWKSEEAKVNGATVGWFSRKSC
jgi:uncharacterized membrane protein